MELSDMAKVNQWINDRWDDVGEAISVRMALTSGYGHARHAKDIIRQAFPELAAQQAAILEAVRGSEVPAIQAAVRAELDRFAGIVAGSENENPTPAELAGRLTPALVTALRARFDDDDIATGALVEAVETAVEQAFGNLGD